MEYIAPPPRLGQKALDDTLPALLDMMKADHKEEDSEQAEYALDGLKQVGGGGVKGRC